MSDYIIWVAGKMSTDEDSFWDLIERIPEGSIDIPEKYSIRQYINEKGGQNGHKN